MQIGVELNLHIFILKSSDNIIMFKNKKSTMVLKIQKITRSE